MANVILFPGQNSRYPTMFEGLLERSPANSEWMDRASSVLGRNLRAHYQAGNPAMFSHNREVQIGVFLANHMHWQNLERDGVHAAYSAGLSLGEYNHLVHIGALTFEDALRILEARGEAYEAGPRGKMAAVFPVEAEEVDAMIVNLGLAGRVSVAMHNTPRQCVLSGETEAVDAVGRLAEDELLANTVSIEERLPMHSPLFESVGARLRSALEAADWRTPHQPYLSNATGCFERTADAALFINLLSRHVWNTVRWRESMEALAEAAGSATFIEAGPKSVLTGFFGKKWLNPARLSTDAEEESRHGSARAAKAS